MSSASPDKSVDKKVPNWLYDVETDEQRALLRASSEFARVGYAPFLQKAKDAMGQDVTVRTAPPAGPREFENNFFGCVGAVQGAGGPLGIGVAWCTPRFCGPRGTLLWTPWHKEHRGASVFFPLTPPPPHTHTHPAPCPTSLSSCTLFGPTSCAGACPQTT